MLKTPAFVENFVLLWLKTFASQLSEICSLDRAALCLLMVEPAQRDEIILIKPPVEIDRERRDMVHRQIRRADLSSGIARPAAVVIPVENSGGFPAPDLRVPESVRSRIAREYWLTAPLVYLVAYRAVAFHGSSGQKKRPGTGTLFSIS